MNDTSVSRGKTTQQLRVVVEQFTETKPNQKMVMVTDFDDFYQCAMSLFRADPSKVSVGSVLFVEESSPPPQVSTGAICGEIQALPW